MSVFRQPMCIVSDDVGLHACSNNNNTDVPLSAFRFVNNDPDIHGALFLKFTLSNEVTLNNTIQCNVVESNRLSVIDYANSIHL
jgi:hypothetical protein